MVNILQVNLEDKQPNMQKSGFIMTNLEKQARILDLFKWFIF